MRTRLNLDRSVMRQLRRPGKLADRSIGELASQLLARGLRQVDEPEPRPFAWVSADLGRPAVDLEDKEALHALLDR